MCSCRKVNLWKAKDSKQKIGIQIDAINYSKCFSTNNAIPVTLTIEQNCTTGMSSVCYLINLSRVINIFAHFENTVQKVV